MSGTVFLHHSSVIFEGVLNFVHMSSISDAPIKFAILLCLYVMRVHYTFIVRLFLRHWSFMDFRGLFCIVDLRPLSLSSSLFADDFFWAMIFLRNA
jgi:hypothetical protein